MSGKTDHGHGAGQGGSSDTVDYGKVIGVGVGSLALFAVSIWWASTIWQGRMHDVEVKAGRARAIDTHRTEIGIVDQVPFAADNRLHVWRAARAYELTHYGWVDKAKGVVRIPIETALEQVAAGAMPAGAPK